MELPVIIFLVVTLGFLGTTLLYPWLSARDQRRIQRRLSDEFAPKRTDNTDAELFRNLDVTDLDTVEEYALLNDGISRPLAVPRLSWRKRFEVHIEKARIPVGVGAFAGICLALACLLGALGFWWMRVPGGAMGFLLGAIGPFALLNIRRKMRREKFVKQLPGAFDLMARVIRSGQSVPQSLQAVAESFDDPLASEFAGCFQQQNLGVRPEVVFAEMANRSDIVEMRIFAMAMVIQRQTGGNLSEVLDRLATLIRSRLRLRRHVQTLTAEGRLQGLTLVVLPFVMFAAMYFLNRKYAQVLLEHGSLLLATGACMAIGILWIRRIVNFNV